MSKYVNARDLRDPKALPKELRNLVKYVDAEARDILQHAADELERLQRSPQANADG